ncbi:MAG: BREX system P-loop protein BrxC [Slackia sp.]|nr:BREX system P-loop protein BrxC [Slackia sp.]
MQIKELFDKDIDRFINGVIKVGQDDEISIGQELSEYVITRELSKHFAAFFETYTHAIDVPTDRIGVWISGFFGSGKSHFLKMLSYLLPNKMAAGKRAIDYFDGKVEDAMVYSQMKRACSIPTEAILFNIDDKASHWKEGDTAKTALLRGFARVFYEHQGFYGEDLKLARLESFIDKQGKTDEFRAVFERINGCTWLECREDYTFHEDDVVDALQEVLGWSEQQARNQFVGDMEGKAMAPEDLVREIGEYAQRRAEEEGGQFRLLFMVDEVGQFIGGDVNLMLNLQTIVENLGSRYPGLVWVMVTSQEAIDEVTKVAGTDFSKIQGRFNTRLSLSSSSVDEVIKRRVLAKNDSGRAVLEAEYAKQSAVLKNLFTFKESQSDLKGYESAEDFQETYPFVGYQFKVMPNVLKEIRRHGNSGKHLSGGERSMLSGFQESAQAVAGCGTDALVPFWRFYDTLAEFLEHDIRRVIDRCQRAAEDGAGLEPCDVEVLKTLYLIRYVNDIKPTIDNIAILMLDSMGADKVMLRERIAESLARLVRENYVSRNGDSYFFLTNEEQDVAREIRNTDIDSAAITHDIAKLIFDEIFSVRKLRVGANDFPFDAYVDDVLHGAATNGMVLNVVTQGNTLFLADDAELALRSSGKAIVVLGDGGDYYEVLSSAAKIERYVRTINVQQLPETTQAIIAAKQKEARRAKREARDMIEHALVGARCAVDGRMVEVRAADAKTKLEEVLKSLSGAVYDKAAYIDAPVAGEGDIVAILARADQRGLAGTGGANERADNDMCQYLEAQASLHQQTAMADLMSKYRQKPYGWREIDIAACVARLIADQKAEVSRLGVAVDAGDRNMPGYLTRRTEADKVKVGKREKVDEFLLSKVRKLLKELPGVDVVPEDEDGVFSCAKQQLGHIEETCGNLLRNEYARAAYPGKDLVASGQRLAKELLQHDATAKTLFEALRTREDDVADFTEDFESIRGFFPNQQRLFDEALKADALMQEEGEYLRDDAEVSEALASLREILAMERPYRRIKEVNGYVRIIESSHEKALVSKKHELQDRIEEAGAAIRAYAEDRPAANAVIAGLDEALIQRRDQVNEAGTLTRLDALMQRLSEFRDKQMESIDEAEERALAVESIKRASVVRQSQHGTPVASIHALGKEEKPMPKTKRLRRDVVCPSNKLSTAEDVDAYVEEIRRALLNAIEESGSVRLV